MRHALLLAVLLTVVGCSGSVREAPAARAADDGVVDVLQVACGEDGAVDLGAGRVRVHPDGLHVEVTDLPDDGTSIEFRGPSEPDLRTVGSGGAAHGTGRVVLDTVAPGTVLVRCYPEDGPRHMLDVHEDDRAVALEVVDHDGHWVAPDQLACDGKGLSQFHPDYATAPAPPAEPAEPLEDVVAVGDLAGTASRTYGYPAGRTRWAAVVEDGAVVSRSTYERDGPTWRLVGAVGCSD